VATNAASTAHIQKDDRLPEPPTAPTPGGADGGGDGGAERTSVRDAWGRVAAAGTVTAADGERLTDGENGTPRLAPATGPAPTDGAMAACSTCDTATSPGTKAAGAPEISPAGTTGAVAVASITGEGSVESLTGGCVTGGAIAATGTSGA
jgi:hypothetical protein